MRHALGLPPDAPPADDAVVMSLLCAALYPQLAFVASGGGGVLHARDPNGGTAPQPANVHPSSVNSRVGADQWSSPYLVFHERVRTTKVYPNPNPNPNPNPTPYPHPTPYPNPYPNPNQGVRA